jgi:Tol biopolymer transport system component
MKTILLFLVASAVSVQILARGTGLPEAVTGTGNVVNVAGAGHSLQPTITPDGRHVVFLSHANNLVTNDSLQPGLDVFVRDLEAGVTTLITVNTSGTGGGDRDSGYPSISANGRFVLFASDARDLIANDTNDVSDVFLRDLVAGTTTLISVNTNGGVPRLSSFGSTRPIMTPDARWVVFESWADDIVADDTNGIADLFLRDMQTAATMRVSVGAERPGSRSHSPSLTPDGRRVAFVSTAGNLIAGRTNRSGDIYVRDLQTSQTFWASSNLVAYFNIGTNELRCFNPVISPDGRWVMFKAATAPASPVHLFSHDLDTGTSSVLARNSHPDTTPALTPDGRWLAFEESDSIYLRDVQNGTNLLVSVNVSGTSRANGKSLRPVVTPDGQHVAFISSASDLLATAPPGGTNISRIYVRDLPGGITHLVGIATNGQPSSFDMQAVLPAISADGQLVAFDTEASDIVPDDNNRSYDVFVRDLAEASTQLVSLRDPTKPSRTGFQSAGISRFSLSANAQRIAFTTYDDDRVSHDTNRMIDTFVVDLLTRELLPQSDSNGVFTPWSNGLEPAISADGQRLLYLRENRSGGVQSGNTFDVIWRSVDGSAQFQLRTNVSFGEINASLYSQATLNSNGALVAYESPYRLELRDMIAGTNRVLDNTSTLYQHPHFTADEEWVVWGTWSSRILASHVRSNRTILVGTNGASPVFHTFDRSGRYFAFAATGRQVYRFDFHSTNTMLICTDCVEPSLNHDGNLVAVSALRNWPYSDIYVVNVAENSTTLISRDYAGIGGGNASSSSPVISADGRYVVFVSKASNLVLNDTNRAADIFVHDRLQNATMMITRNRHGTGSGNALSSTPVLARDGRTVVFQSFAGDLVEGDYNERRDIFMLRLGVGDSDNDGMDDDWEVAHFDNLSRDGTDDADGDGQTDRQEFISGTDPTNAGSVLRVLTITPMGGGSTTVVWSAVPNQNYVVQYKDSLAAANWTNASGVITADSTSESFVHSSSATQRYYRVTKVQ